MKNNVIAEMYPGSTFIGEFALSSLNDNVVVRWYHQKNPDRSKGHKDYFGFFYDPIRDSHMITGVDQDKMDAERFRAGYNCLVCGDITYSRSRHDYHSCSCGNVSVDGGPAYFRGGFKIKEKVKEVTIDLLTQKVVVK